MEKQTIRIRRVGSVTFGVVLVVTGALYLLHLFLPSLEYVMIFRLWPVILILLGIEVLIGSSQKNVEILKDGKIIEQSKVVYDVAAIVLTMVMTGFAMCMAVADWAYTNAGGTLYL